MMDFKGKKYVVTGASSGMGKSCAEMLLNEKAVVCGFDRSEGSIYHDNYTHFQVDITDEDSYEPDESSVYNLKGQHYSDPVPGIKIINGKKYIFNKP